MDFLSLLPGIIITLIFIIFIVIFVLWIINSVVYKVPQVATFASDFKVMTKHLWKYNLKWKTITDFWSWTWKALRYFEKKV